MNGRLRARSVAGFDKLSPNGTYWLRTNGGGRFSETGYFRPVATHHGFLLFAAPAFDLLFGSQGLLARREVLGKYQFQGSAFEGVATGDGARMMLSDPLFEVVSVAGVVAAVGAVEDVDPEGHYLRSFKMPFDGLRANGVMIPIMVSCEPVEQSNQRLSANGGEESVFTATLE